MTAILDTGVLYADYDTDATRHEEASATLEGVLAGEYGQPYVTEYIFDEVVTLTAARTGSHETAVDVGLRLLGRDPYPETFQFLTVNSDVFETSWSLFSEYDDQDLSFTDAVTIACMRHREIDQVVSFDDDFDGLVSRLEPVS